MIKATPLTERSWILYENTVRQGLMRLTTDEEYLIMNGPYSGKYSTVIALNKAVKSKVTFERLKEKKEQEKDEIGGYPVKHASVFEIDPKDGLNLYTKIEGSNDIYVAGYFSVKGKDKWQTVFCPRYNSLKETTFHGSYKSKMDADHETTIENKKE